MFELPRFQISNHDPYLDFHVLFHFEYAMPNPIVNLQRKHKTMTSEFQCILAIHIPLQNTIQASMHSHKEPKQSSVKTTYTESISNPYTNTLTYTSYYLQDTCKLSIFHGSFFLKHMYSTNNLHSRC